MILESLLASVVAPAAMDLVKDLFGSVGRWIGGVSPEDQIKIDQSNIDKMKALAELDNPHGTPSQWVVDLRASFRYIAAPVIILVGSVLIAYGAIEGNADIVGMGSSLATMPFGFIFGERMWLGFKGNNNK